MVQDGKSSQKYLVNARGPQSSILGPTLFLLYINDLPDDVISDIAIYADDTTLYANCDQTSDLWQQLELASELESDRALVRSMKFLSPEVALYLYKSTIHPCMEYCCHVWGVPLVATRNC